MKIICQQDSKQASLILTASLFRLPRLVRVVSAALSVVPGAMVETTGMFRLRTTITGPASFMNEALAAALSALYSSSRYTASR